MDSIKKKSEVFICPVDWIRGNIVYWPPKEQKVQPSTQSKNWSSYVFDYTWTKYTDFKILRGREIFHNFEDATKAEIEELEKPTGEESEGSSSDEEKKVPQKRQIIPNRKYYPGCGDTKKNQPAFVLSHQEIPPIKKRPGIFRDKRKLNPKENIEHLSESTIPENVGVVRKDSDEISEVAISLYEKIGGFCK